MLKIMIQGDGLTVGCLTPTEICTSQWWRQGGYLTKIVSVLLSKSHLRLTDGYIQTLRWHNKLWSEYYVNVDSVLTDSIGLLLSGVPDYCGGATSVKYELLMTYPDTSSTEVVYRGRDTSCRIQGLQPGRLYRFQIRALNDAGVSFPYLFCCWMFSRIFSCEWADSFVYDFSGIITVDNQ